MEGSRAAVTARGVIDGDPAVLESLAQLRGPSVLAYCERVAAPGEALRAAAEAFRGFRSAAIAADDLLAINPEQLLIAHTRRSAAALAPRQVGGRSRRRRAAVCGEVPALLAAEAEDALAANDRNRLRRHLSRCGFCREAKAAQLAGERAYRHPAVTDLGFGERAELLAALSATGIQVAGANGAGRHVALDEAAGVRKAGSITAADTAIHLTDPMPDVDAVAGGEPAHDDTAALGQDGAALGDELPGTNEGGQQREHEATPTAPDAHRWAETAPIPPLQAATAETAASEPKPDSGTDAAARQSDAQVLPLRSIETRRPRGGLGTRFLAPAAVVLAGLAIVLGAAGVFSRSGRHRSSPPAQVISALGAAEQAPGVATPRLTVPRGGPLAPAIPPGTPLAGVKAKHKRAPRRPRQAAIPAPRLSTNTAPTRASAPAPPPTTSRTPAPAPRQAPPKSTARELGSQGSAPPPETGTAPATGGFQPTK